MRFGTATTTGHGQNSSRGGRGRKECAAFHGYIVCVSRLLPWRLTGSRADLAGRANAPDRFSVKGGAVQGPGVRRSHTVIGLQRARYVVLYRIGDRWLQVAPIARR